MFVALIALSLSSTSVAQCNPADINYDPIACIGDGGMESIVGTIGGSNILPMTSELDELARLELGCADQGEESVPDFCTVSENQTGTTTNPCNGVSAGTINGRDVCRHEAATGQNTYFRRDPRGILPDVWHMVSDS